MAAIDLAEELREEYMNTSVIKEELKKEYESNLN